MQSLTTRGRPPFSPSNPMRSSSGTPKRSDRVMTGRLICFSCLRFSLQARSVPEGEVRTTGIALTGILPGVYLFASEERGMPTQKGY